MKGRDCGGGGGGGNGAEDLFWRGRVGGRYFFLCITLLVGTVHSHSPASLCAASTIVLQTPYMYFNRTLCSILSFNLHFAKSFLRNL